jgi:hypothetical protein
MKMDKLHNCNFNNNYFLDNEDNFYDYLFFKFINKDSLDNTFYVKEVNKKEEFGNIYLNDNENKLSILCDVKNNCHSSTFDNCYCKIDQCNSFVFFNNELCINHLDIQLNDDNLYIQLHDNNIEKQLYDIQSYDNKIEKHNNIDKIETVLNNNKIKKSFKKSKKTIKSKEKTIKKQMVREMIKVNICKSCREIHKKDCCKNYSRLNKSTKRIYNFVYI